MEHVPIPRNELSSRASLSLLSPMRRESRVSVAREAFEIVPTRQEQLR
jgi:hypothetical protein